MKTQKVAEFQIQDIWPIALVLVVAGIGIAFGLQVVGDVKSSFTAGTAEYNATADLVTAVGKITSKLPLIATVIVAAILIGILVRYLGGATGAR